MRFRRLGRSDLLTSEVGVGTGALAGGGAGFAAETVAAALDAGVTLVELAAADDAAIEAVRRAIEGRRARVLLVVTGDGEQAAAPEALRALLERLGTDHVDCFLLAGGAAGGGPSEEAWSALEAARSEGLVRASGVAAADAGAAVAALEDGRAEVVQAPHHLLRAAADEPLLAAAEAAGTGLLACSPLAGGRLAGADGVGSPLAFLTEGAPRTVAQAAIAGALSDRRICSVVVGVRSPEQAVEAAGASRFAPLPEGDRERVAALEAAGLD